MDCSVSTNCSNAYCQYAANIERGCNCFDGLDNDGDGKVDKADSNCATYYGLTFVGEGSDCSIVPPGANTPFDLVNAPVTSAQNTADTQSKISVGDVDGDGIPDAVITSKWNSEMRVVATRAPQPDGTKAGDVKSSFNLSGGTANNMFSEAPSIGSCKPDRLLFEHENLIADIDGDGKAELFGVVSSRAGNPSSPPTCFYLVGFKYATGSLVPLFKAVPVGSDRPGTFGIADMDGDGKAEIYLRDRIYAAENGKLLASANGAWDVDVTSAPVAANISGDNKLELICGTKIFRIPSLVNRTPAAPAPLTVVHDMNTLGPDKCYVKIMLDPIEYGNDTHSSCSVADIDNDGNLDVVISGALNATNGKTAVFYWNVTKNTMSYYTPPDPTYANGWVWGTGRVNLIDTDKDGLLDMFFIAGNQLFRIETIGDQFHPDINDPAMNGAWVTKRTINDSRSGVLTVTVYDFNNDGDFELVYRDSQELAVVDAATMSVKQWSAVCQSHTYTEGPVIADVNGDGATDICVPCNTSNKFNINDPIQQQALGQFRLYYSSGNEWLPTRKVWNQPGYFVVNINDDLTLPFPQLDQTLVFGDAPCPNGLPGPQKPLNVFLNQIPFLSANGCPVFPAPDLSFEGDNPDNPGVDSNGDGVYTPAVEVIPPICGDLGISARFNIINDGDLPITDDIPVSFFVGDPTDPDITADSLIYTTTISVTNLQVGQTYTSPFVTFNGTGSAFRLYIVLNNDGSVLPINPSGSATNECRIDNNIYSVFVNPDPFTTKIEKIQDNFKCADTAPNNGEVRVRIFKGATEVTDYSEYGFQWYTGPATSPLIMSGATNYNLTDLAEGDYTAIVTNTAKGCTGIPVDTTVVRLGNDPDVSITVVSHQTVCSPPNGSLQAVIAGGETGYTFEWFDIALNPLGITGPTANNLQAGNYIVRVSKDGCSKNSLPATVDGPQIPDAQASTLQHVVDCLNHNSGSITADATFNGAIQDPANYTFDWYFYDAVTNTRGSILPAAHGTGPTRTALPAGSYQVVITNIATQCVANQSPITTVNNALVMPAATITEIAPQTSCDPAQPNGILTASATATGFVNPNDFTFEWFKGDNTLPANQVTTVSGLNGETVNQVAGGGIYYTVKVTTPHNCSATEKYIITEDIATPVLTLTQTPNSICDPTLATSQYNGTLTAAVTFKGTTVTLPDANYAFTWYNGSQTSDPQIAVADNASPILTGLNGGHYTAVVERTDLHCPSSPVTRQVQNAIVLPAIETDSIPSTNCVVVYNGNTISNGQISITTIDGAAPTADYTFLWRDNGSPTDVDGQTTSAIQHIQGAYTYTVEVTNRLSGCVNSKNIPLPDNSVVPVVSLAVLQENGICDPALTSPAVQFNGRIGASFITPSGNVTDYQYTWRRVEGNVLLGNTPPAQPGWGVNEYGGLNGGYNYSVVAENTVLGCTSGAAQVFLPNSLVLPVIKTDSIASTNCVVTYNGNTIANGQAFVATVDGAPPTANYTFLWSDDGSPTNADGQTTTAIQNIQGGYTYTVQVTNRLTGCRNTDPVPLADASVVPVVSLAVLQENGICDPALTSPAVQFNGKIGASFITPSGNVTDYKYTWRRVEGNVLLGDTPPAQTGSAVNEYGGLDGGYNYSVIAENTVLGCTSGAAQVFLPDNLALPVIETDSIPSTNCVVTYNGTLVSNGRAFVTTVDGTAAGSTTNYLYQWSDDGVTPTPVNSTSEVVQNIQGGFQYAVQVTNKLTGCRNTHTLTLPDNQTKPVISVTKVRDNVNCDPALGNTGELYAVVTYDGTPQNDPTVPTALPPNYIITWSTSTTGDVLAAQPAGSYSAFVVDEDLGCTSDPDAEVILDDFVYPSITIPTPVDQTSCDASAPNGAVQATVSDGSGATFVHTWFSGVGTGGTQLSTVASQADGATSFLANRASNDYTIFTRNEITGCEAIKSAFIPNNITYPSVAFTGTSPVTICSPTPNGDATPNVSGLSALPDYNYTVYYVETFTGNPYPTDPAVIKGGTPYNYTNAAFAQPPVYGNMAPGYLTALVVDNNTRCESTPETIQIHDATEEYTINIDGTPSAGFCGGDGGGIQVTVERGGVPCTTCTYEWYNAAPVNTDINFFNNPPDMGGVSPETLVVGEDLGMPASAPGVGAGTYTLIVVDSEAAHAGCGNYFIETVPFTDAPVITVTETDVTKCILPFDGAIEVDVTGTSAAGYTVQIFEGNGPSGTELTPSSGIEPSPVSFSKTALAKGQYYVQVTDMDPANSPCPLGSVHQLDQLAFSPLIALNQVIENTSCDPATSADGKVELTATADGNHDLVLAPTDFRITNIMPAPIGFTPPQDLPDNGTSSGLINGFAPGAYTITVTDNNSGCAADAVANIPDQPVLPKIFTVDKLDDSYCAPASNGQIAVVEVGVGGAEPFENYEFEWYSAPDVTVAANRIYTAVGGGATTGEVFDGTKSGWSFGTTPGAGNGNRQYYVRGRRITGSGVGCYTQLEQMVVLDVHKTPSLTLTPFANTSCIVSENEGVIRAVTDIEDDPRDTNVRNTGTYTYSWTPDPAGGNTSGVSGIARTASFDITALDANSGNPYTVTSINSVNGCAVTSTTVVPDNKLPITLIRYTKQDQLICDADGNITISEVMIDASTSANPAVYTFNTAADLIANFNFEWYNAADDGDDDPSTFDPGQPLENMGTPITDVVLSEDNPTVSQRYLSMGEGTYYVIARREPGASPGAGCATVPTRIEIIKDVNLPQITDLKAFANTSCVDAVVEGRIELSVNTTSGVAAETASTYSYSWVSANPDPVNNPYGDGNEANTASSLTIPPGYSPPPAFPSVALKDETYTITVTNDYSGCTVTGQAIVPKQKYPITLISYTKQDQLICDPDGNITITQVTIDGSTSGLPVYHYSTAADLINNFDFAWYDANNDGDDDAETFDDGIPLTDGTTAINAITLSEDATETTQPFPDMGAGDYYAIATRKPGMVPGAGCKTLPIRVTIEDKHVDPVITSLQAFANTSCVDAVVEGRIELSVNTTSGIAAEAGSTYSYSWVSATPDPVNNPYGDGNALNTTSTLTIPPGYSPPPAFPSVALKDDTYTITVTNNYSGCAVVAQAIVPKQTYPITLINYTKQDQLICDPDGNITVTQVTIDGSTSGLPVYHYNTPADLINNFDFSWYDANNDNDNDPATFNNTIRLTDGTNPINHVVLSADAAETTQPFPDMKAGTYHVLATRKPGMVPGAGCTTQAVRVDIQDLHADPRISFTSIPNSSCNSNGNGVVTGTAFEQDNSVGTYSFAWTFKGNPLPPVPDGNTTEVSNAMDGAYTLTARNLATGCPVTSTFNLILDQTRSTPNIIDVATVDPVDCNPSASAEVTKITLGSTSNSVLYPPNVPPNNEVTGADLANFVYEWYAGTPPTNPLASTTPSITGLVPQTYYVLVRDPSTDCKSGPKEVVINPDDIVYPVVTITQSQRQISCPSTHGTGELMALADGHDDTNSDYSFTWYNNLTASGSPLNATSTSTLSDLISGDYSVLVTNAVTGCSASEVYIIQNESDKYLPVLSLTPQARVSCLTPDGALLVREVQDPVPYLSLGYSFNYSVEYYEGEGDAVDLTIPGIPMPSLSNRTWMVNTLDTMTYTVKIRDNNTSCITTGVVKIPDGRKDPVVVIVEDNPMRNCDPDRPNGQLSATADNGQVGGYAFQWFEGDPDDNHLLGTNNKLIGLKLDVVYTVRVTNNQTGCYEDAVGEVSNGIVYPPDPTASVVQDRTHCINPDGWVTANVNGTTMNYIFLWSDGTTAKATADFKGVNYTNRDIGPYTVTAQDIITGCISPPETVEVKDARVYPDIVFTTTPSFCEDIPDSQEGTGTAELQLSPADLVSDEITWFDVSTQFDQETLCLTCPIAGTGSYLTGMWPGFYQANVLTSKGCQAVETVEIKTEVRPYNLVTRNNDGKNDRFVVDCISRFKNNNVKIFNRSGVLVYEADGYNNDDVVFEGLGKEGIYTAGNDLPVGTYFYIIDKRDGTKPKTGYLELVK